jgi:predicted membrane chloride channel (bestrophin family)
VHISDERPAGAAPDHLRLGQVDRLLGFAIAIPVVIFVFYVLASLELIADEIEDPFGVDANDLPL